MTGGAPRDEANKDVEISEFRPGIRLPISMRASDA